MKTVKLMVSTNEHVLQQMLEGEFNTLVWASDNMETVAHYYEGAVVEITVRLINNRKRQYLRSPVLLSNYKKPYGWGSAGMACPEGATWYSFSKEYLEQYLVDVKEIFPDLTPWHEENKEE